MKFMLVCAVLYLLSSIQFANAQEDPKGVKPPAHSVPSGLIQLGDDSYYNSYVIVADKFRRTLSLWRNSENNIQLVDYFPMDHGKKAKNKQIQGDLKTPEGIYFIQKKKGGPRQLDYNEYGVMAFTLNYPNFFDRLNKKTGGGIWLHSIPPTKTLNRGSRGCLVVREKVIKKLDQYIKVGQKTPVLIFEKVRYVSQEKNHMDNKTLNRWLNNWKSAWLEKDIEKYMSFYSQSFYSSKKNYTAWKRYKKEIFKNSSSFSVAIKKPIIYKNKKQIIFRFLQEYSSENLSDYGEKILFIRIENKKLKIVHEGWHKEKQKPLAAISL